MQDSKLKEEIEIVAVAWKSSPYYESAEAWIHIFWASSSVFKKEFEKLNLENVVELACGHGRHSEQIAGKAAHIIMIDIHEENSAASRRRLGHHPNITFMVNDGASFKDIPDQSVTAIFCYDAMVHFSLPIIEAYLKEAHRILSPGGRALFHHSNYAGNGECHYGQNPHARNIMTQERFCELAESAGLAIVSSQKVRWGGVDDLDCLTLVEK